MILDANLLLDTAAAITATTPSTNVADMGVARDMGIGDGDGITPKVLCFVSTAFATTNSGTLTVAVQGSTDNSTWDTYFSSPAYAAATLVAGARLLDMDLPRPPAGKSTPRYYRTYYTVANAFTGGAVTSAIVLGRNDQPALGAYPSGFTVAN